MLDCELENLFERIYRVLTTYRVSLEISNMVVGRKEDLDGVIRVCRVSEVACGVRKERIHSFRIVGSGTPSRSSSLWSLIESCNPWVAATIVVDVVDVVKGKAKSAARRVASRRKGAYPATSAQSTPRSAARKPVLLFASAVYFSSPTTRTTAPTSLLTLRITYLILLGVTAS